MKNNRYILVYLVLISLLCIVSISAISGSENVTKEVISTDNNQKLILDENIKEDVSQSSNNKEVNSAEEKNEDDLKSNTDKPKLNEKPLTSTKSNKNINSNSNNANSVSAQKAIKCKIETSYFKENNNNLRLHIWLRGPDYKLIGGVKLKIHETYKGKSKDHYVRTLSYNQKEIIFKHLGIGTHKYVITSTNPKYQASTTIRVTIPKKTIKTIIIKAIGKGYKTSYKNIRPDSSLSFYREIKQSPSTEKLYVELWHPYVSSQPYKITKVQYFFKNAYNGKVIKRTISKVYKSGLIYYTALKIPAWYYKPMGAKVWYRPV
ncbi:hypothetical protein [uncultured Methanobrevibacter sp.]|uniref:hypothetical protein n=1 Tax=uncultured Methanobrevibacter sp. TaxID=253161 RepID=UPI0025F6D730|nr:hypothetical protein [uncultured Methanobrevibacter sp.]